MQYFPAALQELADRFARLPGIGGKTAQRLAFHVLELPLDEAQAFAQAILAAKAEVHTCPRCQNLTDRTLCPICDSPERDQSIICVVAEAFCATKERTSGLLITSRAKPLVQRSCSSLPERTPCTGPLGVDVKKPDTGGFSS